MPRPTFSFIIPTRGRLESLERLCASIRAQTCRPERLEIILVVDTDDLPSVQFKYPGLNIRKVAVAPGLTMGTLDMSGYCAATGDYLMLLNDDMVIQTPAWDDRVLEVFERYPDGMVLVHINETIFREKLCTFPFLPRAFCKLMGGICPEGYVRYRIDDHIHNIFDLLMLLGYQRRIFLSDVVFQHFNLTETAEGHDYVPVPEIHALDTRLFEAFLPERKRLAMQAAEIIERYSRSEQRQAWEAKLEKVTDSVAIRDPRHARMHPPSDRPRATVAVVSGNIDSPHARQCLERLKAHTSNYDLAIIDNNGGPGFNHPREMNRLMEFCRTEYLVLLDDDVFVEEGWLEGMMRAMSPGVGVVTPAHKDRNRNLSYAGVVMQPDDSGHHTHVMTIGREPQNIQTLCSAAMLIDMAGCGNIRLDETYSKYFLDIDYGLRMWEHGHRVVCSPWTTVTHIGGATLEQGSHQSAYLFEEQRRHWVQKWVETRRIHQLRHGVWKEIPEFADIARMKREIDALFFEGSRFSKDAFFSRVRAVNANLDSWPALRNYMKEQARQGLEESFPRADDPQVSTASILLGVSGQPVLYEAGVDGMNIVLWNSRFYALPGDEGAFDYERMRQGGYSRSFEADSPADIRQAILGRNGASKPKRLPQPTVAAPSENVVLPLPPLKPAAPPDRVDLLKRLARFAPYLNVLRPPSDRPANLFDAEYYLRSNPDVAATGINPLLHFILVGGLEGRKPHPLFDSAYYLCRYPDVAAAGINPLAHYLKYGAKECRQPHPFFDTAYYLGRYPDVRNARMNPLLHYVLYGAVEGRQPHPAFDPSDYIKHWPEIRQSGVNPLVHHVLQLDAKRSFPRKASHGR